MTYNVHEGIVLGNLWGGGIGGYKSRKISGYESKEKLIKKLEEKLADGTLDSGMGFESLNGAVIIIEIIDKRIIDGKEFINTDYEEVVLGEVTDDELEQIWVNMYL